MVGDFHLFQKTEKKETMVGDFDLSKTRKEEVTDADFLGGGPGVSTTGMLGSVSQTHPTQGMALYHPLEQIFLAGSYSSRTSRPPTVQSYYLH